MLTLDSSLSALTASTWTGPRAEQWRMRWDCIGTFSVLMVAPHRPQGKLRGTSATQVVQTIDIAQES